MILSQTIRDRVTERIRNDVATLNARFNKDLKVPQVAYDARGSCGGRVSPRDNYSIIHLNPALFVDNEDEMVNTTTPHELAHWAENQIFGGWERIGRKRSVHGTRWKNIMMVLKADPCRFHNMNMSKVQTKLKKYEYICGNEEHAITLTLSSIHHNRILRGATYRCKCGGVLELVKVVGQVSYDDAIAARSQKRPKTPTAPASPKRATKKSRAQAIIDRYPSTGRAGIIAKFISELDMSKAGANTYYYNLVTNSHETHNHDTTQ